MKLSKLKQEVLYPLLALSILFIVVIIVRFFPLSWGFKSKPKYGYSVVATLPVAPRLSLADLDGKRFDTVNFKGKVVVVNFWAAWCTPCAKEVPQFVALQEKYENNGLQVIGISIDDSDKELRDFYQRYKMNYPVIAGDQKLAESYGGILGLPTTLLINRDGFIEKKFIGAMDFATLEQDIIGQLQRSATTPHR